MREIRELSAREMRQHLREAFASDPEKSLLLQMGKTFLDPLKPEDSCGRPRVCPLWIMLAAAAIASLGLFFYLGLFGS